jgi:hypothetical protein
MPREEDEGEAWKRGAASGSPSFTPEGDPDAKRVELTGGPMTIRGPTSDVPEVPRRPECVPHVVVALEPSPADPPTRGRWARMLGHSGVTRHAVRIEDRDGFLLVGSDLLGLVDLRGLGVQLDALDARDPETLDLGEHERFVRFRARQYRWSPETATRPEGLVAGGTSAGPRFEAGDLDGDVLQAMVRRQRKVRRPVA